MNKLMDFPVKFIDKNLGLGRDGSVWAGFEIEGFGYDHRDPEQKKVPHRKQLNFLTRNEHDLHYLLIPYRMSGTDIINQTIADVKQKDYALKESGLKYLYNLKKEIEHGSINKRSIHYHGYFLVQLKSSKNRYQDANAGVQTINQLREFWRGLNGPLRTVAGLDPYDILDSDLVAWHEQAAMLQQEITAAFSSPARPLKRKEMLSVIDYNFRLEQENQVLADQELSTEVMAKDAEGNPIKAHRPIKDIYYDMQNAELSEHDKNTLKMQKYVNGVMQEEYVRYLVINKMDPEVYHPGFEWVYRLQNDLNFPIGISIRACHLSNRAVQKGLSNALLEYKDQSKEARKAEEEVADSVTDSKAGTRKMEKIFQQSGQPGYACSFVLRVSGKTMTELDMRVEAVQRELNKKSIKTKAPYGDGYRYFMEFVPTGKRVSEDYWMTVSPAVLAHMMFGATTNLGDNRGFLIGFTKNQKKPVFLQPDLAAKGFENLRNLFDSPSMMVAGETGKGKSVFMNLVASLSALILGSQVLIIDPKGDRKKWADGLPFIDKEFISIWKLGSDERDKGALDPFRTSATLGEAKDLCINILSFLADIRISDPRYPLLAEAVDTAGLHDDPCVQVVIDSLEDTYKNAPEYFSDQRKVDLENLLNSLKTMQRNALGGLLFGVPGQDYRALSFDKPIQVIMAQNLELPIQTDRVEKSDEMPTPSEKISEAILLSLTAFTKQFMFAHDETVHKIILQDEAKTIEDSKMGARLLDWIVTKGRYYNTTLIKGTQRGTDFNNSSNIGMKACFYLSEPTEAEQMLQYFNLPVTQYNVETIQSLEKGECLFQDIYGRSAVISVNTIFKEFLIAFKTNTATDKEVEYEAKRKALEV